MTRYAANPSTQLGDHARRLFRPVAESPFTFGCPTRQSPPARCPG